MTERSRWGGIARRVGSRDTRPERAVRRLLHVMGYRFRLHGAGLPGRPDIVFRARRKAIFVHGCFWHGHGCRPPERRPKAAYWVAKVSSTRARDAAQQEALEAAGWTVLTVWECELEAPLALMVRLRGFLGAVSVPRRRGRGSGASTGSEPVGREGRNGQPEADARGKRQDARRCGGGAV